MFLARIFARSRVWKLLISFCALCAFAFTLGQGAAAIQRKLLTQTPTQTLAAHASQISLQVSGAQGTTPTPAAKKSTASQTTSTRPTSFVSKKSSLTTGARADAAPNGKGKHHPKHLKAAGEGSHGGQRSGNGPKGQQGQQGQGAANGVGHGAHQGQQGGD